MARSRRHGVCGATQGSTGVRQDTEEVGEKVGKSLYGGLQSVDRLRARSSSTRCGL